MEFLTSNRFWALALLGGVLWLGHAGFITPELANSLSVLLGGFVGVRTIDRLGEKVGG